MLDSPANKLDPKIKAVWTISALLLTLVIILPLWGLGALICFEDFPDAMGTTSLVFGIILVACLVIFCGILPNLRYARWRYERTEHQLEIRHGIIWRTQLLVPFIRVQDTNTHQGPLMRAVGLASVTVSTAAGSHTIPGVVVDEADALRGAIAEQARLAREEL